MIKTRDIKNIQSRLSAYYRRSGLEDFPINSKVSSSDLVMIKSEILLSEDEFLITCYKVNGELDIYISSKSIYFIKDEWREKIRLVDILAVYLNDDFKNEKTKKELTFLLETVRVRIEFEDLKTLVEARTEIHHIINAVIENWVGKDFRADKFNFQGDEIRW